MRVICDVIMLWVVIPNVMHWGCRDNVFIEDWRELTEHFRENCRVYSVREITHMEVFCFSSKDQMHFLNKY